jgi:hypothetical protein
MEAMRARALDGCVERIIKTEGLTFALASSVGKEEDLREARAMLKAALVAFGTAAHAAGHAEGVREERAEAERLRNLLLRIDGANDNPSCFNVNVDAVLRDEIAAIRRQKP